jgi:hypothetical protein
MTSREEKKRMKAIAAAAAAVLTLAAAPAAHADINVVQHDWALISTPGVMGTLRAGSGWDAGSLAPQVSLVDGSFLPESTQWNHGTWWWDQDPSINASPVVTQILLNGSHTIHHLMLQADNNDAYQVDFWNGASWQAAWTVPAVSGWGMTTRSIEVTPFATDRFRITAASGDNFYAISEFQALAVPEPDTYWMFGAGLLLIGGAVLRRRT